MAKADYRAMTGETDGVPGMVVSIQTFGNRAGNYNPHLHCLASDGVFFTDGTFVRSSFLQPVDMAELFRSQLRTLCQSNAREGPFADSAA